MAAMEDMKPRLMGENPEQALDHDSTYSRLIPDLCRSVTALL